MACNRTAGQSSPAVGAPKCGLVGEVVSLRTSVDGPGLALSVIPGWCVSTRPGISRFRVRCLASPRNDGGGCVLLSHPFRRALLRKRLRALDVILRGRHCFHCGVLALFGDRLFQRDRKALLDRLL